VTVPLDASLRDWKTRPFPSAAGALRRPEFRVSGTFCWQGHWNYNFWSNFTGDAIDAELDRLAGLHFNTGLISLPWGVFQSRVDPPEYRDDAYGRLEHLLDRLEDMRMYAILRVGSAEHAPQGIAGGCYDTHSLFLDDSEIEAYAEFFFETARRLRGRRNVLFMLHSWEDLQGYLGVAAGDMERRLRVARETGSFHRYLGRKSVADWNRRWGTDHERIEQVPLPTPGCVAFRDLLLFCDERLQRRILPAIGAAVKTGDPDARLSFEVRVDPDCWIDKDGVVQWIHHQETWSLPPTYDYLSACWNGTWGARNDGSFLDPHLAVANLRNLLDQLASRAGGRQIFLDQLNVNDSTPGFSFASRLCGEEQVLRFLDRAMPLVYERTLGFAFWGLEPAESNILLNSNFASGFEGWRVETSAEGRPSMQYGGTAPPCLRLPCGSSVSQDVEAGWNPGRETPDRPLTVRAQVRSRGGGALSVRFESADEVENRHEILVGPIAEEWTAVQVAFPFLAAGRFTLRASGSGCVWVRQVSIFNHRQDAAVLGPPGTDLVRRAELFERVNRCWQHGWED